MKRTNIRVWFFGGTICLIGFFLYACNSKPYTPKPRGYLRTDFSEKRYHEFDSTAYPYRFEYPVYACIVPDKQSRDYEPYWVNIRMPDYNATIHLSYKRVNGNLAALLDDTHNFVYRHVIKADAISELAFVNPEKKVYGFLYELEGEVASSIQFYATDSTRHFLRGSLYFMATPNVDSLAPSVAFLLADIEHMMHTLAWK